MSVEVFLLAAGIRGESLHPQHEGWIEILDYMCLSVPTQVAEDDLTFRPTISLRKPVDCSSPLWELSHETNRPVEHVRLEVCGGDGARILLTSCELTDVRVDEYVLQPADDGAPAMEHLRISYATINWTYHHAWSATPLIGVPLGRQLKGGGSEPLFGPPAPAPEPARTEETRSDA